MALLILSLGTVLVPIRGEAQVTPLHLEMSGGAWIPTTDLVGAAGFDGGASAEVSFGAHFLLNLGRISYRVGFSEHRFGCNQTQCAQAVDFVSTAWDLGVRLNIREAGLIPWVGLGASAALVDAHVTAGTGVVREASDRGWGYEVGVGVLVPIVGLISINPSVRYGRVDVDFVGRGTLETQYITADVGVVLAF